MDDDRKHGLITVSSGNHAQAVAWTARQVGVPCAVVMPADAPHSKVDAVKGYGGEIILHDDRATLFDKRSTTTAPDELSLSAELVFLSTFSFLECCFVDRAN